MGFFPNYIFTEYKSKKLLRVNNLIGPKIGYFINNVNYFINPYLHIIQFNYIDIVNNYKWFLLFLLYNNLKT